MTNKLSSEKVFVILKQNQVNPRGWSKSEMVGLKNVKMEPCSLGNGNERKVKDRAKVQCSGRIRKRAMRFYAKGMCPVQ